MLSKQIFFSAKLKNFIKIFPHSFVTSDDVKKSCFVISFISFKNALTAIHLLIISRFYTQQFLSFHCFYFIFNYICLAYNAFIFLLYLQETYCDE